MHRFHDLQEGEMAVTDSVFEYDGCVNFLASAHHREALKAHPLPKLGLLGSGQGANVLLTDKHKWASSGSEVLRSMRLYAGVNEWARRSAKAAWEACGDVQTFRVVNRGFLYTNSGANSTAAFGVLWSPFVSAQFVRAALRLAPSDRWSTGVFDVVGGAFPSGDRARLGALQCPSSAGVATAVGTNDGFVEARFGGFGHGIQALPCLRLSIGCRLRPRFSIFTAIRFVACRRC